MGTVQESVSKKMLDKKKEPPFLCKTLFPNQFQDNNRLQKNQQLTLPTKKELNFGLDYIVSLLPDKDEDMELLKVIATKKPLTLVIDFEKDQNAFEKLQKSLVNIPRNEMETINLSLYLHKK